MGARAAHVHRGQVLGHANAQGRVAIFAEGGHDREARALVENEGRALAHPRLQQQLPRPEPPRLALQLLEKCATYSAFPRHWRHVHALELRRSRVETAYRPTAER